MLKVGGENVAAAEIEGYLLGAPGGAAWRRSSARPTRATPRCPAAFVDPQARRVEASERGADRALPRRDRDLQGAALRALRRGVADVGHEDPEVQAARGDHRGAGGRRDHRGAADEGARAGELRWSRAAARGIGEAIARGWPPTACRSASPTSTSTRPARSPRRSAASRVLARRAFAGGRFRPRRRATAEALRRHHDPGQQRRADPPGHDPQALRRRLGPGQRRRAARRVQRLPRGRAVVSHQWVPGAS